MNKLPNRYRDSVEDDDDIDYEEWMDLPKQEQDRQLDAAMRELEEVYRQLTPLQIYRRSRRLALGHCITYRDMIRQGFVPDFAREQLRQTQIRMVKRRIERATGQRPGSA